MVYIGNIFKAFENLNDKQMICLISKSKTKYFIHREDTIERMNGDLKVSKSTGYCIIDVNEVENIIVTNTEVIERMEIKR